MNTPKIHVGGMPAELAALPALYSVLELRREATLS
jgi:hypothetical protein